MTQIVDSLPDEYQERILCHYKNATSRVQIARITNIPRWYLERVVFPNQHLLFELIRLFANDCESVRVKKITR